MPPGRRESRLSSPDRIRLLLIEDNEDDAILVTNWLRRGGLEVSGQRVETADDMAGRCAPAASTW